jgi:putrescine aminotransferase
MSTSTTAEEVLALVGKFQSRGRKLLFSVLGAIDVEREAQGAVVETESGRRYLDFGSYSVFLLGHRRREVVEAVHRQLDLNPGTTRLLPSAVNALAAKALATIVPGPKAAKVMFLNSGAEAVEAAIKIAAAATGRSTFVHLEKSFHGKTLGALSLTDNAQLRAPFSALLMPTVRAPRNDAEASARIIRELRPAAVFCEAIQGEGGIFELSNAYLRAIREAASEVGALLVCDEIQCGLGRAGTLFGFEPAGIAPDIVLCGKALGGGVVPVSAVVAREEVFRAFDRDPFLHTSTFGGNPLACAAVLAALDVIGAEDVPARTRAIGEQLGRILRTTVESHPSLFESCSGRGALWGLQCRKAETAGLFAHAAVGKGLLVTPCIGVPNVVRFSPPAFVTAAELGEFEGIVDSVVAELESE